MNDLEDARQKLHDALGSLKAGGQEGAHEALAALRVFQAQQEQMIAQHYAGLRAEAERRRASADPYERAAQAHRDGDPHWRDLMPLRWHISRWWDIWSVPLAMTAAIIAGAVALFWWLT